MATRVVARGKWKEISIDRNLFREKDLEDFVCIEELTDYVIVDSSRRQSEVTLLTQSEV